MRDKAADALIEIGMPMSQTGFLYILDIMELFEENGAPITNMNAVYDIVAKNRKQSIVDIAENVCYSIKYVFENGNPSKRVKYFGIETGDNSIGNYMAMLYYKLKEEAEEQNED